MVDREGMIPVIARRYPGAGRMAGLALGSKQANVEWRVLMAGNASRGCACKDIVHMALSTFQACMCPIQREIGQ